MAVVLFQSAVAALASLGAARLARVRRGYVLVLAALDGPGPDASLLVAPN